MGSESHRPHILFFPLMAHGHMIPMLDIAKLFASRNLKATILTTPLNELFVSRQIGKAKNIVSNIDIHLLSFPTRESGLPEGCENFDFITSKNLGMEFLIKFFAATTLLQDPLEKILRDIRPNCLVADMSFPWATESASKFRIPRLFFHGTCCFSLCIFTLIHEYKPHKNVSADSEPFVIPNLPGGIKLARNQLPFTDREESAKEMAKLFHSSIETEVKSFGVIVNSFYELEAAYVDHYTNILGRRVWTIGPVSLSNRDVEDKARRGKGVSIDEHACLKWLDSKKPNSVVYLCFGSLTNFKATQLNEIAIGLESSQKDFIWVIRENTAHKEDLLPEGFESRNEGKGLVIRGWAPQIVILEHEAIGGFVTHCGWNSTLEAITAGVPMATWPFGGEQFYNEKLVVEVLKIGVSVGVNIVNGDNIVRSECVEEAVNRLMEGEEAEEMRRKARELGKMARNAVEEGGSSYSNLNDLIDELIKLQS